MNKLTRLYYSIKYMITAGVRLNPEKQYIIFNSGLSKIYVKDINEYDRILNCIDLVHKQYPKYSVNEILNILRLDLYTKSIDNRVYTDTLSYLTEQPYYTISCNGVNYIYYCNMIMDIYHHIYYYNKECEDFSLSDTINLASYKWEDSINYDIVECGKPGIDLLVYCYDRLKDLFNTNEERLKKLDIERKKEEANSEYIKLKEHWINTHPNKYIERDNLGNVIDE